MVGAFCFGSRSNSKNVQFKQSLTRTNSKKILLDRHSKPKYLKNRQNSNQDSFINNWKLLNNGINKLPDDFQNKISQEHLSQFKKVERQILHPKLTTQDFQPLDKPIETLNINGLIKNEKIVLVYYKFYKEKVLLTKDKSKAIRKTLTDVDDSFSLKAFINEIALLKSCDHENIIKFKGVEIGSEFFCLVTELEGRKLSSFLFGGQIDKWWETSISDLMSIGLDIAKGIKYLHGNDIIHRNIKSSNIYLYTSDRQKYNAKISNFSMAYSSTNGFECFNRSKTALNIHIGTPRWMAPEIQSIKAENGKYKVYMERYSTKSDVYAYGITLSEIFSAMVPFWSIERQDLKNLISAGKLFLCEFEVRNDVPDDLINLIWDCTNFDKILRPESIDVLNRFEQSSINKNKILFKKRIVVKRN